MVRADGSQQDLDHTIGLLFDDRVSDPLPVGEDAHEHQDHRDGGQDHICGGPRLGRLDFPGSNVRVGEALRLGRRQAGVSCPPSGSFGRHSHPDGVGQPFLGACPPQDLADADHGRIDVHRGDGLFCLGDGCVPFHLQPSFREQQAADLPFDHGRRAGNEPQPVGDGAVTPAAQCKRRHSRRHQSQDDRR